MASSNRCGLYGGELEMASYNPRICDFRQQPMIGRECLEAVWSQGKSCRECNIDCYRKGLSALQATSDNRRLVHERNKAVV